jgi:hypothetical protein
MIEPLSTRYSLTDADFFEASVAHQRYRLRSPIVNFGRIFFIALLVITLASFWLRRGWQMMESGDLVRLLVAILLLVGALVYLFHPSNLFNHLWIRHQIRSISQANRSGEWGFDPEGIWTRTELLETTLRWELFKTIVESPKCLLCYQGDLLAFWIVAHSFASPEMLRTFTEIARSKVPNYLVLGECQFPTKPEPFGLDEL